MPPSDIIAWLIPTARGSSADKAVHLPSNTTHAVPLSSSDYLISHLPNLLSKPSKAIQLSFSTEKAPKRPSRFVVGTDPYSCDVVLPPLPGIATQHCTISFDAQGRLVLEDCSETGTQVWYGWESTGDRTNYTWVLATASSPTITSPPPAASFSGDAAYTANHRITIDIQGLRFHFIPNTEYSHSPSPLDRDDYRAKVEAFRDQQPAWAEGLTSGWDRVSVQPVAPLFSEKPLFKHVFVNSLGTEHMGEMYLWDLMRPWEPMVKAVA